MSLYSWNVIATVIEHRSISQAASILNLTPSAVSHMIRKTEETVGYEIFIRERNRFELTAKGKLLFPYIQNYLKSGRALEEEILRLKTTTEGTISIASYNNIIRLWLPAIIESFSEKYPNVKISIRQANDVQIKDWIEHGEIDLALVYNASYYESFSFIPLHKTPLVCFTPKSYKPRNGKFMTATDLHDMPIILRTENFDDVAINILANGGISLDSCIRIDNDESCYEFIRQGFGFRLTSEIAFTSNDEINMYPIDYEVTRTFGMISVIPQYISPAVNLFRKEVLLFFSDNNLLNV